MHTIMKSKKNKKKEIIIETKKFLKNGKPLKIIVKRLLNGDNDENTKQTKPESN